MIITTAQAYYQSNVIYALKPIVSNGILFSQQGPVIIYEKRVDDNSAAP
jgi:hypothetical protein